MAGLAPLGPKEVQRPEEGGSLAKTTTGEKIAIVGGAVVVTGLLLESRWARWLIAGGVGVATLALLVGTEEKGEGEEEEPEA